MANPWLRLYSEFSTDAKVQMMSEPDQRRLIMLLCLRCNGDVTLQDDEVTFLLRISNDEWANTKALFVKKGFINDDNELLNWDKRQFTSNSSTERVARHREKKKQQCNVTVMPPDTDTDTDTDKTVKEKIYKKENSDFEEFWCAYPKKTAKQEALKVWKRKKPPIDEVLKALSWQTKTQQWIDGFMPNPATYLNQGRWEDEPCVAVRAPPVRTKLEQTQINARSIFKSNHRDTEHERIIEGTAEFIEH